MADHEHGAHASANDEYLETPPGSTYEHTDAHTWIIVKFLWWLAVSAVVIHVGLGVLYELMVRQATEVGEQRYPLAVEQEPRLPPAPRLQQFPTNDLYQFRIGEQQLLESYGWMNRDAGIVHIPIADAMRLLVERGMPARASGPTAAPDVAAVQPATPAETPVQTPGLMPADSSSGRTMERRRQ
jgi:hypothetical protein